MKGDQVRAWGLHLQLSLDLPGFCAQLEGATTQKDWVADTFRNPVYHPFKFAVDLAQPALEPSCFGLALGGQLHPFLVVCANVFCNDTGPS